MPDTVTLTREWFSMLKELPDDSFRRVLYAVANYAFDGTAPDGLSPMEKCMFNSIKPKLMRARQNARYYSNKSKASTESDTELDTELDTESVGLPLFNIKEVNSSTRKSNIIDNTKALKENYIKESHPPKRKIFVPPTLEEVTAYCLERFNSVDPESFISFYQSKDWFIGKNKMKDWKAAVRTWERARKNQPTTTTYRNQRPVRDYSGI